MNRDESGLLRAIVEEGLLTAAQGKRVARAIDRGASLEEALGRTPLIDPLDYHKLMRQNAAPETTAATTGEFSLRDRGVLTNMDVVATYDLAEDEGIPMLQRLYELVGEAFYGGMSGLEIGRERMDSGWARLFDGRGTCVALRPLEASQAEKMLARLRVMARIAPSRKTQGCALFVLQGNGLQARTLLESEGDVVRLLFYRDAG